MCAGSPRSIQPQSPYRHALQHSPPDHVGVMRHMASSPHQVALQNQSSGYPSQYSGMVPGVQSSSEQPAGVSSVESILIL